MVDKYETCKDCPDRVVQPNCHSTCEGYLARRKKYDEANEKRFKENSQYFVSNRSKRRSLKRWEKNG